MGTVRGMAAGNLSESLDALLSTLGVERTETRDQVSEAVQAELSTRGHDAQMIELRYGVLTLEASQVAAQLLQYDRDNLLAALEKELPGIVQDIKVRVRRR